MGASRYFFSMSGMILLIGALAIGGRGLNLGIDFTSGTRDRRSGWSSRPRENQVRRRAGLPGCEQPRGAEGGRGHGAGTERLPDLVEASSAPSRSRRPLQTKFGIAKGGTAFDYHIRRPDVRKDGRQQRGHRDHRLAARDLRLCRAAIRVEVRGPVLIALMHDLLITSGVYALTGREVTTATVAALLTILGYSLYDTIIVFDRVRENMPRMPRAAFSQIVNRSMSEVLTRSLATTSCTLMPILALLLFGGGDARRTSRSRCSSASRPARTRRSSSPRRCSRTGRSASLVPRPPPTGSRTSWATSPPTRAPAADVEPRSKRSRRARPADHPGARGRLARPSSSR